MPEFLLRYRIPQYLDTDIEIEAVRQQALAMAMAVQEVASQVFNGWEVAYEVRPLGDHSNMADFTLTGWVTDNDDVLVGITLRAQELVLETMRQHANTSQKVECWWQRVKGKWSSSVGALI